MPSLTVLMPVYNAAEFLPSAIESILAQTHRDFTFVIVDDGSTDDSGAIIRRYAAGDSRIVPLAQPNAGATAALNAGLRGIATTYVARMDADDIALPQRFARQLAVMEGDTSPAALGARVQTIDRKGNRRHVRAVVTGPTAVAAALPYRNALNHPSVMLRTAALAAVGGYRERFRMSQDYDLWLRLSERYAIDNLDETLLLYRTYEGRSSSAQNRARQTAYSVAAAADHFARKYGLPVSEAPVDVTDPSQTIATLTALLDRDVAPPDRRAIYRHSLRLIRYAAGTGAVHTFGRTLRRTLLHRREYGALGKAMLYGFSSVLAPARR